MLFLSQLRVPRTVLLPLELELVRRAGPPREVQIPVGRERAPFVTAGRPAGVQLNAGHEARGPESRLMAPKAVLMRQWLRRRLEPNPPLHRNAIDHWMRHERLPTAEFLAGNQALNPDRMRWIRHHEIRLYNNLRNAGTPLPRLPEGPHGPEMSPVEEDALIGALIRKGAFATVNGSVREDWQQGLSARDIWTLLREEGYVFAGCFSEHPRRSWHGWAGMLYNDRHYPPLLENQGFLA